MEVCRCFERAFPMRSRCFWPEVKFLFFKKVRAVFRALAKKIASIFNSKYKLNFDKLLNCRACHLVGPLVGNFSKKMRYGHGEHLEMELEVVLWICFRRRIIFLVFEEKKNFDFFSLIFFHRRTFSSGFQWIFLHSSVNNLE